MRQLGAGERDMELTMSMFATQTDYWKARAELAERTLGEVAGRLGIGEKARTASTILTNVENAARRSRCLSMIESHHTITVLDDDGEEMEEQLLNWGEEPDQYIETYRAVAPAEPERFFPFEFEVWQDDEMVASASGPRENALREAMHYAAQYEQDGLVRVFEVVRTLVTPNAKLSGRHEAQRSDGRA